MTRTKTAPPPSPAQAGAGTGTLDADPASESTPLRKAAILLVSLEGHLASQLLAQLERSAVEAVTLEIARLERIEPAEQQAVLEEFYGLGVRRLRFVFEDLVKMDDREIREAYHDEDAATWALALAGAAATCLAGSIWRDPSDMRHLVDVSTWSALVLVVARRPPPTWVVALAETTWMATVSVRIVAI